MKTSLLKFRISACLGVFALGGFCFLLSACGGGGGGSSSSAPPPAPIPTSQSLTPEQMIMALAADLDRGDALAASKRFARSTRANEILGSLDSGGRSHLASAFRNAQLVSSEESTRVYKAPWNDDDGSPIELEFTLALSNSGEWVIVSW